jgi:adenylosuccinate lyase
MALDFNTYQSPFSWRYGSPEMRYIWSEVNKRKIWRRIWVSLAEIQSEYGFVTREQVADLQTHMDEINIKRALEFEKVIRHDVMAEVKAYAEACPVGGKIIHLGMTSMDIVDNADILRIKASLNIIIQRLEKVLILFCEKIHFWAGFPTMGFTHLQPAEPTTVGYRLAQYAQNLFEDWQALTSFHSNLRGKGLKGAVGTRASYSLLFPGVSLDKIEDKFSEKLGINFYPISSQTYPRHQDYNMVSILCGLAATIYKFAFDLRFLQTPSIGEWGEPFRKNQVGSTAMPFKRNPIQAEKINSLARMLAQFPRTAWDNAAHSLLERTLDDSANRRSQIPEALLITEELLISIAGIIAELRIDAVSIERTNDWFAPFAAQEILLMELTKVGADRQVMHEILRNHAIEAWEVSRRGDSNPLIDSLGSDTRLLEYLNKDRILAILNAGMTHVGDAQLLAERMARTIEEGISKANGVGER